MAGQVQTHGNGNFCSICGFYFTVMEKAPLCVAHLHKTWHQNVLEKGSIKTSNRTIKNAGSSWKDRYLSGQCFAFVHPHFSKLVVISAGCTFWIQLSGAKQPKLQKFHPVPLFQLYWRESGTCIPQNLPTPKNSRIWVWIVTVVHHSFSPAQWRVIYGDVHGVSDLSSLQQMRVWPLKSLVGGKNYAETRFYF